jgi:Icc-related predicted phosphoesterase
MRCLVLADVNPKIDLAEKAESEHVDLIISLGDFERSMLLSLQKTNIPKIGVYGNHDSGEYMQEIGMWNLHMHTWKFGGYTFGGFQGCVRYKQNPYAIMYTQEEANQLMANFPPVDIFITHCPPRGINDEDELAHQGFDALRKYVDTYHPKVLFHGHTYPTEENIVRNYNGTRIEYVSGWRIVEI